MIRLALIVLLFGASASFSRADTIALVFATNRTTTVAIDWEDARDDYNGIYILKQTRYSIHGAEIFSTSFRKQPKHRNRQYLKINLAFRQYNSGCFEIRKNYVLVPFSKCIFFDTVSNDQQ